LGVIIVASGVLGLAYVFVMPRGLPYDEPSHWLNVLFYLDHHRLPVIGEPGVTYEAQMGPVAYALDALVAAPWSSAETAFYVVRVVGLLELMALALVVWRLAGKALPGRPAAALVAAAVVGLNPMLLAIAASVQNDVLAILLGGVALDLASSRWSRGHVQAAVVGVIVGVALLTKVTVWPVAVVLAVWFAWRAGVRSLVLYGLSAALVSGWWFIRNLHLYGDLTGKRGVDAVGYDFPALGWQPVHLARDVVTTLWIPVEYVRNAVVAPPAVEVVVIVLTVVGLVGMALLARGTNPTGWMTLAVAALAVAGWMVLAVGVQAVSFRIAFTALYAWSIAVGALAATRWGRPVSLAVMAMLVGLNGWFLLELAPLGDPGLLSLASSGTARP
jgi:D-alanyl-D-alanine carboxypeptidase (penicillin-binding protein 5/6)